MSLTNILESLSTLITNNFWIAPLIALLAGLLTSVTPCSLASIPLVIGYVGGKDISTKKSLQLSLIFALGTAVTFTALGVIATLFGDFLGLTGGIWYIILGVFLILMVLEIWEVTHILPKTNFISKNTKKGFIGSFITGLLAGLISSPCSTPVLIAILAIVGTSGDLIYGIILLLCYAIGHSALVVAAGTSVGFVTRLTTSPKYARFSQAIKIVLGLAILALALYLIYTGI